MNRLVINLEALQHNIRVIDGWMQDHGASWTLVTKVLCGHRDTLKALQLIGIRSIADARLANIRAIERVVPDFEAWYLRLPHMTAIDEIAQITDVSLNTEIDTILALNEAAKKYNRIHRVIIMIELGDLREGIMPGTLVDFYKRIFDLPNVEVLGIGANLGCLSGAVPNIDQLTQLALYKELLELKFQRKLPMISGGSSSVLPLMVEGRMPKEVNHFRIGESAFLGTDLINGGVLPGLRDDAFILETEIVEIKEKSLVPLGETTTMAPFEAIGQDEPLQPGARGYRALVTMGQVDSDMGTLTPLNEAHKIAGASSDVSVINLGENPDNLRVGDPVRFKPSYTALLRLMLGPYVEKVTVPGLEAYEKSVQEVELPPVVQSDDEDH